MGQAGFVTSRQSKKSYESGEEQAGNGVQAKVKIRWARTSKQAGELYNYTCTKTIWQRTSGTRLVYILRG